MVERIFIRESDFGKGLVPEICAKYGRGFWIGLAHNKSKPGQEFTHNGQELRTLRVIVGSKSYLIYNKDLAGFGETNLVNLFTW